MASGNQNAELKNWLRSQSAETCTAVAVRIALRQLPKVAGGLRQIHPKSAQDQFRQARDLAAVGTPLILPVFRAVSTAWAFARYPTSRPNLQIAAARAAAWCVRNTPVVDSKLANATDVGAAAAAYQASFFAIRAAAVGETEFPLDTLAARDVAMLKDGVGGHNLVGLPIWVGEANATIAEQWRILKNAMLATHKDWRVWTDWYEARMKGAPEDRSLEIARAEIPDGTWESGPRWVNGQIERQIKASPSEQKEDDSLVVPGLRPAAVEPVWRDARLTLSLDAAAIDLSPAAFANALSALNTAARELVAEMTKEANIDKRFIDFMSQLAETIPLTTPPRHELFVLDTSRAYWTVMLQR